MEGQAFAQAEAPQQAVILEAVALDHLRLRLQAGIHAVELVIDHQRVVAGDVGRGHHRVDHGEVGLGDVFQHPRRGRLRERRARECQGAGTRHQSTSLHDHPQPSMRWAGAGLFLGGHPSRGTGGRASGARCALGDLPPRQTSIEESERTGDAR